MKRWLPWIALAVITGVALSFAAFSGGDEQSVDARVKRITAELRCEECQGLSVADSTAPTSEAIRTDVRRRIDAGQSDSTIKQAYVDRYGDDILLTPSSSGISLFVWLVPVGAFVLAVVGLGFAFRRWRHGPWRRASADDQAIVDELRSSL